MYDDKDNTEQDGAPVTLYRFELDGRVYRYTTHPIALTGIDVGDGANVYVPRQIERTAITLDYDITTTNKVDVYLPINDQLSYRLNGVVTPKTITLDIYEYHATDPDKEVRPMFSGVVVTVATDTETRRVKISATDSPSLWVSQTIPNVTYSRVCNVEFGGFLCGVDTAPLSVTHTVTGVNVWSIEIDATLDDTFIGGVMLNTASGVSHVISHIQGNEIFALGNFGDTNLGDEFTFTPGCDHLITGGCAAYGNVINFKGFPGIPRKNPFVKGFGEKDYSDGGAV